MQNRSQSFSVASSDTRVQILTRLVTIGEAIFVGAGGKAEDFERFLEDQTGLQRRETDFQAILKVSPAALTSWFFGQLTLPRSTAYTIGLWVQRPDTRISELAQDIGNAMIDQMGPKTGLTVAKELVATLPKDLVNLMCDTTKKASRLTEDQV